MKSNGAKWTGVSLKIDNHPSGSGVAPYYTRAEFDALRLACVAVREAYPTFEDYITKLAKISRNMENWERAKTSAAPRSRYALATPAPEVCECGERVIETPAKADVTWYMCDWGAPHRYPEKGATRTTLPIKRG